MNSYNRRRLYEDLTESKMRSCFSLWYNETEEKSMKLLYLGLPCRYFSDSYYQRISAGRLTDEDVAVGISYSGASKDTVDAMRTAKRSGAVTRSSLFTETPSIRG